MLIKGITHISLFILITASFVSSSKFPGHCRDCEEEVWEEVPCATLSNSTTTTTPAPPVTLPPIITTTIPPPPPIYTAPSPPISPEVIPPLLPPLPPTPIAAAFKKCYCECKAGCREFCRKTLVTPDVKKTITQVSKTGQTIPAGIIEIQHLHQRNFVPTPPYVPAPPVPAPVPAPPPPAPAPYVPAPAPLPVPVPPPAPPAPSPYNRKPYPASGSSCGTVYPVESSAEMDDICGGSCPTYNNPPASQQPTKYYPNPFDFTGFNSIDDLSQLLRSASYSNPGNVYFPSAPSAPAAPNNYPSYPPPPPGAPISLPPPPNNYPSYPPPPPPPVRPSPPKLSKYSTSPKSYKRPPVYSKSPVSNNGPSAAAAATAGVKSPPAPNANCPGCSGSSPNENIDLTLGDYYKDYLFSNSAAGSDYPGYQLTYPISY